MPIELQAVAVLDKNLVEFIKNGHAGIWIMACITYTFLGSIKNKEFNNKCI
jgi:hypothetical protein